MIKAKKVSVADYIGNQIAMSGKSQREIAEEVGYPKANVITMIKQGSTKLPINKVPVFAKSLGVDTVHLLRVTMNEYMPETWEVITSVFGNQMVSESERKLIEILRDVGAGEDIFPETKEEIEEFRALAKKWRNRSASLVDAAKRRVASEKSK